MGAIVLAQHLPKSWRENTCFSIRRLSWPLFA
jgi:hypothetical protein